MHARKGEEVPMLGQGRPQLPAAAAQAKAQDDPKPIALDLVPSANETWELPRKKTHPSDLASCFGESRLAAHSQHPASVMSYCTSKLSTPKALFLNPK